MVMVDLLQGLNPEQRCAVEAGDGPVLVLAGPGSGKTRVLTHRIAYLIAAKGVDPYHILAVTFTNKAAREMRERLDALIGVAEAQAIAVGTFHSLCARFLRRDIVHLGCERDFVIYDTDDQERLMRRVLRDLNLSEKQYPPHAIHARISSAKNELITPQKYAHQIQSYFDEIVARCYERYQELLREANALDFDDLLVETVRLFEQHPDVLATYQERYTHLLVDEYQDTNHAQYTLVRHLAARRRNLFVVGDADQSIYGWRGADKRNIERFEQDYPEAQVILLERNYRSTQNILDAAMGVINASPQRRRIKRLWTDNGPGAPVILHEGYDQDDEAAFVADEIARLVASGAFTLRDCAVMYRTNAQSRVLEEAFSRRGLRYQLIGGLRFWERKEIKDTLAYLRSIYNPYDSVSLMRVLNWPPRGIGERTEGELVRWAATLGVPIYQALKELEPEDAVTPFPPRTANALRAFLKLLDGLIAARRQLPLPDLITLLVERIGLREALFREYNAESAEERWANIEELSAFASRYTGLPLDQQLPLFLEEAALVTDIDRLDPEADAVTCITLHQAKGLEYPVVFLVGLEEGLLPHSRSANDREQLEEERRLLYVGMTRAKQRLYLCYAFRRVSFNRSNINTPSRFLADIPQALLRRSRQRSAATALSQSARASRHPNSAPCDRQAPVARSGPATVSFFPGQRVRHGTFGEGVVVSSRLIEGDEEVTVSFADRERRLLASFARLERLS